ncbi:MAG: phosphatidylinositol-3-phosphatase, partial [Solirubrobacteraceae bacterium]|nr:phosphatidylinositol-3-phosphatase [Solirubrobacteraceae bacterium]
MRRLLALCALMVGAGALVAPPAGAALPPVGHVFVVFLENKNYVETFSANTDAPYFANDLAKRGQLLTQYYGIGHLSLDNYIATLSGQGPNPQTQADCQRYSDFLGPPGLDSDGQALGEGCVYPTAVKTLADQLAARGLGWKGYMQDMGTACRHPAINGADDTQSARVGDEYAARHNPFVYFHSIIDSPDCARNDVPLAALDADLASVDTTPAFSFITPNLCEDGHDSPCVDGRPGGLKSADAWLQTWIPKILASPAFQRDGMLVVTFDEAESGPPSSDASACCNEPIGPNTPNNGGPVPGQGGGRIGGVVVSPFVQAGSVNPTAYNHYALLRTFEDLFGVAHLGFAGRAGLKPFGGDVFANAATPTPPVPAGTAGGGSGGGGSGGGSGGSASAAPCPTAAAATYARAAVRPRGSGFRVSLALRGARTASVTLTRLSGAVAARRAAAGGGFSWTPPVPDGVYVLRLAARRESGGVSVRRLPV